jgi:hypothetical protein
MALDEPDNRLFVATRTPSQLAVFDTNSGRLVATLPAVQDSDDLYYDSARKRVYIPGGEGHISVFQQEDADHYKLVAKVQTAIGARTAGYFGKGRKASTASTWPFPLAPTMAPKYGSTRCRTRASRTRSCAEVSLGSDRLDYLQEELTDCMSENQGAIGVQCAHGSAAFADVLLRVPRPITMAMSLG